MDGPVDFPTLGWGVLDFMESTLAMPDGKGGPLRLTSEQARIVLEFYRVDGLRRRYRRGLIMTPKGWGTSPVLAMLCAAEALADVVPDHFDAEGQVVGVPWSDRRTPYVHVAAVSEGQTGNVWDVLLEMLRDGPARDFFPGLVIHDTVVKLPRRGEIIPVTSAFRSQEGKKPVMVAMDQTEAWVSSNGGRSFAATCRRNAGKVGGVTVEGPNAFTPGDGSVAESSFRNWERIRERKTRGEGLLVAYREAPATVDLSSRPSLLSALAEVYGDATAWVDLDRLVDEIWDLDNPIEDSRRFYLNQLTQATDAWLRRPDWTACFDKSLSPLLDGERVALGFDGSRRRMRGISDATVLHACRLSDGKLFEIAAWEQPEGAGTDPDWEVPQKEVDMTVRNCFSRFDVAAFFADPAKWESYTDSWEADFGRKLKVRVSEKHPIQFWLSGPGQAAFVRAVRRFGDDVSSGDLLHAGDPVTSRHVLNARRRLSRHGIHIAKSSPDSPNKIDAAVSAVLAYAARNAAVSRGVEADAQKPTKSRRLVRR